MSHKLRGKSRLTRLREQSFADSTPDNCYYYHHFGARQRRKVSIDAQGLCATPSRSSVDDTAHNHLTHPRLFAAITQTHHAHWMPTLQRQYIIIAAAMKIIRASDLGSKHIFDRMPFIRADVVRWFTYISCIINCSVPDAHSTNHKMHVRTLKSRNDGRHRQQPMFRVCCLHWH